MKMKIRNIVPTVLALAVFFGCEPDHRLDNLPDSAVYFVDNVANNGVQEALLFDVQSEVEVPVYVYCSGNFGGTPDVSATVEGEEYLAAYNEANGKSYQLLPVDCYTMTKTTDKVADRKAKFAINFSVEKLLALSAKEDYSDLDKYVVALRLESNSLDVAEVDGKSLGYYIVHPKVIIATMNVSSTGFNEKNEMYITLELPFDNFAELTYEVEFGKTSGLENRTFTEKGNHLQAKYILEALPEGTVIENENVSSMAAGTNKVEYKITLPSGWEKSKSYNYAFEVKNAVLNGRQITINDSFDPYFTIQSANEKVKLINTANDYNDNVFTEEQMQHYGKTLTEYGLQMYQTRAEWVWDPQTSENEYFDRFYNGNGFGWQSHWSGGGYGSTGQVPVYVHIDMKKKQPVCGLEWWRRGDQFVGDTKKIEIYAFDDCTYTHKGGDLTTYSYTNITYLGSLDFGPAADDINVGATTFDQIETQHLMLLIVESTRSNACDCAECVIWY